MALIPRVSDFTREREYVLAEGFTRVTGLICHCRRGKATFFFFFFIRPIWRHELREPCYRQNVCRPFTTIRPSASAPTTLGYNSRSALLYSRVQRLGCVVLKHRHSLLRDDRSAVHSLVHKMDRAARDFHAVIERLLPRLKPGKSGQQRGMNVHHPIGKRLAETRPSECA